MAVYRHGIFCLEGDWWGNLKRPSSVEPILQLLGQWDPFRVPSIHRDVDTAEAFWHYLGKWTGRTYADYPILYLAFHGEPGCIFVGDKRRRDARISLDDIADFLAGKCPRRIVYFGTCATVAVHGNRLNAFMKRTGALAVCGYIHDVDWLIATGFELLVLAAMQQNCLRADGVRAMKNRILREAGGLARRLGFRMILRR